jgi:hypothetical protein
LDLIPYFPRDPEIYHIKSYHNKENLEIGEFGSAEAPDGKLRDVDKAEAEAIGLLNNTYTQVLLEDESIKFLKEQQK